MINHLVRKGVEMTHEALTKEEPTRIQIPTWGVALLAGTAVFFFVFINSIYYTLSEVIGTLTMVETPTATVIESQDVNFSDDPDAPLEEKEPMMDVEQATVTVIPTKPITSKIRATIKHLAAHSGNACGWRGLKQAIIYNVLGGVVLATLRTAIPHVMGAHALTKVLVCIALSPVHAALTHRIIAKDSPARIKTLTAPLKTIKYLWAPAAFAAAAEEVIGFGFRLVGMIMHAKPADAASTRIQFAKVGVVVLLTALYGLFVLIPTHIGLIRVEAAFLPDDEDTVVPFDRTFGGNVFKTELGGWERHMVRTAFRSSNWEVIRRVLKLYTKIAMITFMVMLVGVHVIGFELWVIMGTVKEVVMSGRAQIAQMFL